MEIKDRTFLVTGGGSGLGLATSGVLAQAGGNVLLVDINASAGQQAATDLGPELTRIDCPTLVLVGAHDTITGVDESRLLADTIPGAELHVLADAGHVAIQERPDAAADLVADFVRGLS